MPGQAAVDGAYFGTTFPHLLFMTYEVLLPEPTDSNLVFVPRIFGFRVHQSSPLVARVHSEQPGLAEAATSAPSQQECTDRGRRLLHKPMAAAAATATVAMAAAPPRAEDGRGYLPSYGTVYEGKQAGASGGGVGREGFVNSRLIANAAGESGMTRAGVESGENRAASVPGSWKRTGTSQSKSVVPLKAVAALEPTSTVPGSAGPPQKRRKMNRPEPD